MTYKVHFYKDRQKFSAAHFTLFEDGTAERLHGHNYVVTAALTGSSLDQGLLFPFHRVKPLITRLCDAWDERVLLPLRSPWLGLRETERQWEVTLNCPPAPKFYSFPKEDVVFLDCDNISSENLAALFAEGLVNALGDLCPRLVHLEVTVSESSGQSVTYCRDLG